jgi:hypothetical protein
MLTIRIVVGDGHWARRWLVLRRVFTRSANRVSGNRQPDCVHGAAPQFFLSSPPPSPTSSNYVVSFAVVGVLICKDSYSKGFGCSRWINIEDVAQLREREDFPLLLCRGFVCCKA